ncbi:MAG: DUF3313 domain-containing protein [Planctomycetota bacterium]
MTSPVPPSPLRRAPALLALVSLVVFTSCATTRRAGGQELTGFLQHYDEMTTAPRGAQHWRSDTFNPSNYDSVRIEAIEVLDDDEQTSDGRSADADRLVTRFVERLEEGFEREGWRKRSAVGGHSLALHIAFTELSGTNPVGNTLTRVPLPSTQLIKLGSRLFGFEVFVGSVAAEMRVVDGETGELLLEAYGRRVGNHSIRNIASRWGDVEDAMDLFADRVVEGLSAGTRRREAHESDT